MIIVGTRPEAIKMAPVHRALRAHDTWQVNLLATGQHSDLLDQALAPFGLVPDQCLDPGLASVPAIECALIARLMRLAPDLVLVQGDTSSALAAALAAHGQGIPVGHVEAGLRSHDLNQPWPEESNRISIDRLSTLLFAPTPTAMANLDADPMIKGERHLTGNSGIDALMAIHPPAHRPPRQPLGRRELVVTLHRRETIGAPLQGICEAIRALADRSDISVTLPVHPNPDVKAIVCARLAGHAAINLCDPLPYPEMLARLATADLILSDSGGLQEEAPALGVPLLILRDVTERPEAIICGSALLAGTDPRAIEAHATRLLDDDAAWREMAKPRFPFGRGDSAARIVAAIENYLGRQ